MFLEESDGPFQTGRQVDLGPPAGCIVKFLVAAVVIADIDSFAVRWKGDALVREIGEASERVDEFGKAMMFLVSEVEDLAGQIGLVSSD